MCWCCLLINVNAAIKTDTELAVILSSLLQFTVFPKLCTAAHWCAAEEAEVCGESFMF